MHICFWFFALCNVRSSSANERKNTIVRRGLASAGYFHRSLKIGSVVMRIAEYLAKLTPTPDQGHRGEEEAKSFQDGKVGLMA